MHFKVRQNWMAASPKTAGWPARPLGIACHASSGSSQTFRKPRRLSEALYAGQFVVRYRARGCLLPPSCYQDHKLNRGLDDALCNNALCLHKIHDIPII
jgi:hypothetical protein